MEREILSKIEGDQGPNWPLAGLTRILKIYVIVLVASFFTFSVSITFVYRFIPVPLTPLMTFRAGQALARGEVPRFKKTWVPLEKMSPRLVSAVIAAEDMKFFEHSGFDWEAIETAHRYNRTVGRTARGASTISQQTAKNVFLLPQRSWIRKGLETYFTALLELTWPKTRIMEVYLNVIELGDGIYGVEAASRRYFNKPASQINPMEAALMAAVLPNPLRMRIAKPSSYVRLRQTKIRRRMPASSKSGSSHSDSIPKRK